MKQVAAIRSVVAALAGGWDAARDVQLDLSEPGVCNSNTATDATIIDAAAIDAALAGAATTGAGCCAAPAAEVTSPAGRGSRPASPAACCPHR